MNHEQMLLEEVMRYISDDTYDYALMLDGDWGSGKTYFVKEVLNKELNRMKIHGVENRVRYYSACGVETLGEFKETMVYDLLERKVDEMHEVITQEKSDVESSLEDLEEELAPEKKGPVELVLESKKKLAREIIEEQREERRKRFDSLKATRAFRVGVDIGGKMITGLLKSKVPFLGAVDAKDYLTDVEGLQDYVFIIDDIERCSFSVSSLLGFINEMVEHVHAKVILVINEDALMQKFKDVRYAGEYADYLGIRGKLVGTVLHYSSDMPVVLDKLIRGEMGEDAKFSSGLRDHIPEFCAQMKEKHHHSLRTFQFFLSRLKNIEEKLKESEAVGEAAAMTFAEAAADENRTAVADAAAGVAMADAAEGVVPKDTAGGAVPKDTAEGVVPKDAIEGNAKDSTLNKDGLRKEVTDRMLSELFDICLRFRGISQQPKEAETEEVHFKSLRDYVKKGLLDVEKLKVEIAELSESVGADRE